MKSSKTAPDPTAFWKVRSKSYERLQWANRSGYLNAFIKACDVHPNDDVLDIGTGTGIVARALSSSCRRVVGVDVSPDMLAQAAAVSRSNTFYIHADCRRLPFPSESFSKITARMVFHHITQGADGAMKECFRVLRPGGLMVLSEGIPPTRQVRERYEAIFRLKEERITFYTEDLVALMEEAGFTPVRATHYVERQVSVRNWLKHSGLTEEVQELIFEMHTGAEEHFKNAYAMTITEDDCLIDMTFAIVVGVKRP